VVTVGLPVANSDTAADMKLSSGRLDHEEDPHKFIVALPSHGPRWLGMIILIEVLFFFTCICRVDQ
jgi:hypothetical protein